MSGVLAARTRSDTGKLSRIPDVARLAFPALAVAAITGLLYLGSLRYGFMYDDPLDLRRSSDRSYLEIFTSTGQSNYYRPLILALWKTLYNFLGGNDAPVLHALVLVTHALNGFLVFSLGRKLAGYAAGTLSGILFTAYPFSYQAVAYVNSFFHPLVTMFVLLALLTYYDWRTRHSHRAMILCALVSVLALLTHENGMTLAPLIVALEVLLFLSRRVTRPSLAPAYFVIGVLAFFFLWLARHASSVGWQLDLRSMKENALFFFQGLVYPISVRPGGWSDSHGLSNEALLLALGLPLLGLLVAIAACFRRVLVVGCALAWFVIAVAPVALAKPFDSYVIDGPRLIYLASAGASLLWGSVLTAPLLSKWPLVKLPALSLGGLIALAIIFQSAVFVQGRDPLFSQGAAMVQKLYASASNAERPGRLYVNFPSWLTFKRAEFLVGHSGVSMIPDYVGLGDAVYVGTGKHPEIDSLYFGPVAQEWVHWVGPQGRELGEEKLLESIRKGGAIYVTRFLSDTLDLDYVGQVTRDTLASAPVSFVADFGGWARLLNSSLRTERGMAMLALRWRVEASPKEDFTIFVHVYDQNMKIVAQRDGYALGRLFPPMAWQPGDLIEDVRYVPLPLDLPPGRYSVVVGLYDRSNGQRPRAMDAAGKRLPNDAFQLGDLGTPY